MKCSTCVESGLTSQLFHDSAVTTCMGGQSFYDEHGVWHDHDPNATAHHWRCSNGHTFTTMTRRECPGCKAGVA